MDNNLDLSSLVTLIMQNPDIIAKVAALAKQNTVESAPAESTMSEQQSPPPPEVPSESDSESKRKNRQRLFSALRPYLSSERAKTLSSVEAMVAIIDSMKI